jgi:hypothetical protein
MHVHAGFKQDRSRIQASYQAEPYGCLNPTIVDKLLLNSYV